MLIFSVFAADPTASLSLTGTVAQNLSVSISSNSSFFSISENGATVNLPDITFLSNLKSWAIKVYSTNGSILKNTETTPETIAYTFAMGALFSNITLQNTIPTASSIGYKVMTNKTAKTGDIYSMSITYSANGDTLLRTSSDFTDTIIIVIAAS